MASNFINRYSKSWFRPWSLNGKDLFDCQILISFSAAFKPSKSFHTLTMHYSQSTAAYAPVADFEFDDDRRDEKPQPLVNSAQRSRVFRLSLALCAAIFCTVLGFCGGILVKQTIHFKPSLASITCTNPVIRREWRDLSDAEKSDYIGAVQCLRSSPSRLGLNQTLYDDFPYVHSRNGEACE